MTDFDAVRAAHPELIVNLYAMTPGGAVTLEVITPDGQSWTWTGVTAAECIAQAFPDPDVAQALPPEALKPPETGSIFD